MQFHSLNVHTVIIFCGISISGNWHFQVSAGCGKLTTLAFFYLVQYPPCSPDLGSPETMTSSPRWRGSSVVAILMVMITSLLLWRSKTPASTKKRSKSCSWNKLWVCEGLIKECDWFSDNDLFYLWPWTWQSPFAHTKKSTLEGGYALCTFHHWWWIPTTSQQF